MASVQRRVMQAVTVLVAVAAVVTALYIMVRGLGLADSLDFGAGAYYYADIPGFETIFRDDAYHTEIPYWAYVALFLAWGWLMYRLWCRMERRDGKRQSHED